MGSMSSVVALFVRAPAVRAIAAAGLATLGAGFAPSTAEAKTPGHQYCFYGTCHRVQSIAETERLVGSEMVLHASFYDDCKRDSYNPCGLTSSGEAFRPDQPDNAASPVFPDGTTLLLFNPRTKGAAVVRVNNAGPYWGKRKLDVSRAAAEKLGFRKSGVAELKVRVIKAPSKAEATYKRNRNYARVPGYLGQYSDAKAAHRGMATLLAMEAMAGSLLAPVVAPLMASQRAGYVGAVVAAPGKPEAGAAVKTAKAHSGKGMSGKQRPAKAAPADSTPATAKGKRTKIAAIGSEETGRKPRGGTLADEIRELTPLRGLPQPAAQVAAMGAATLRK